MIQPSKPDRAGGSSERADRSIPLGLVVALTWFIVDQGTKWLILERIMVPPRTIPVTAFFDLVLGWNRGVSFGLLSAQALPAWSLAFVSAGIAAGLTIWLFRTAGLLVAVALGLIIGGALGNALDRVRHGAVTDFLDFYIGTWHWPAFNLADVGVVCGAGLLILDGLLGDARSTRSWRR